MIKSHSVFACETALKCAVTIKYFDPERTFSECLGLGGSTV